MFRTIYSGLLLWCLVSNVAAVETFLGTFPAPMDQKVTAGHPVTFICLANFDSFNPDPDDPDDPMDAIPYFSWYKIPPGGGEPVLLTKGQGVDRVTFTATLADDGAAVFCLANGAQGHDFTIPTESRHASLTVINEDLPPRILTPVSGETVPRVIGSNTAFPLFEAEGLDLRWEFRFNLDPAGQWRPVEQDDANQLPEDPFDGQPQCYIETEPWSHGYDDLGIPDVTLTMRVTDSQGRSDQRTWEVADERSLNPVAKPLAYGPPYFVAFLGAPMRVGADHGLLSRVVTHSDGPLTIKLTSTIAGLDVAEDGSFVYTPPLDSEIRFPALVPYLSWSRNGSLSRKFADPYTAGLTEIGRYYVVDKWGQPSAPARIMVLLMNAAGDSDRDLSVNAVDLHTVSSHAGNDYALPNLP